jgi:hypothetical protein
MSLKVKDDYRTNALSLIPGGEEVTVIYENGKSYIYDKVKKPSLYIKNLSGKSDNTIAKVLVNGKLVWDSTVSDDPWVFKD